MTNEAASRRQHCQLIKTVPIPCCFCRLELSRQYFPQSFAGWLVFILARAAPSPVGVQQAYTVLDLPIRTTCLSCRPSEAVKSHLLPARPSCLVPSPNARASRTPIDSKTLRHVAKYAFILDPGLWPYPHYKGAVCS